MSRSLAGIIACVAFVMALAGPTLSRQSGVSIPRDLAGHVAAKGSASVIVGVSAPFVEEGRLAGAADIDAQRRGLQASLDDVMGRASANGITVGGRFETVPYFTARVGPSELQARGTPGVVSIHENELFTAQPSDTVALINTPAAWAAGAGSGWTVAVIDTGIDKAHPSWRGRSRARPVTRRRRDGTARVRRCVLAALRAPPSTAAFCTADPLCAHGTAAAARCRINGTRIERVAHQAS